MQARAEAEIDAAFETVTQLRAGALLVDSDPFFNGRREQVVALAARHAMPAMYDARAFVVSGGLMTYGGSLTEVYRQAGVYTGKILNGAKRADLPIMQPTKVELVSTLGPRRRSDSQFHNRCCCARTSSLSDRSAGEDRCRDCASHRDRFE